MLKIFISWSGARSRAFAQALHEWLPRVNHCFVPWFSPAEIDKGDRWSKEVREALQQCNVGILCITAENYNQPWICFEAGALSKQLDGSCVIPLLFGVAQAEIDGPLAQFQCATAVKADMLALMETLNRQLGANRLRDDILRESFNRFWPKLSEEIAEIANMVITGNSGNIQSVVKAISKYSKNQPELGSVASFDAGFEDHGLYNVVANVAQHRLWIFGRKNRKIFDKSYAKAFRRIRDLSQFDLRLLFLDPNSAPDVVRFAHAEDTFSDELGDCLRHADGFVRKCGLDPVTCFRMYGFKRNLGIIVVDDAVLFRVLPLDQSGRTKAITDTSFSVLNATSRQGTELIGFFLSTWESANPWSVPGT